MLRLESIRMAYTLETIETVALDGIDLAVGDGEFLAVMGPSGCGKSSLLNVIGTLDRPLAGHYWFHGQDLTTFDERRLASFRAQTLGFVFQSFNLIDALSVQDNIALGLAYRGLSARRRRELLLAAMDRVGISHRARHFPHQLSGGQQQRAAIARAIVGEPRLILADEPTGNLDSENGANVMDILRRLNADGATIVMVTHSPAHADMAGRRIDLLDGRIVSSVTRLSPRAS